MNEQEMVTMYEDELWGMYEMEDAAFEEFLLEAAD